MHRVRYIPQHKDGYFITVRCERTHDMSIAVRFHDADEVKHFLYGMYGPDKPDEFEPVALRISYELEVAANVQEKREHNRTGESLSQV